MHLGALQHVQDLREATCNFRIYCSRCRWWSTCCSCIGRRHSLSTLLQVWSREPRRRTL